MKILVIFTGGTIGSEASGEYISIDGIKPYKLLHMYADAYPDEARDVRFDTESPNTVLSENADGNTFKKCGMSGSGNRIKQNQSNTRKRYAPVWRSCRGICSRM